MWFNKKLTNENPPENAQANNDAMSKKRQTESIGIVRNSGGETLQQKDVAGLMGWQII